MKKIYKYLMVMILAFGAFIGITHADDSEVFSANDAMNAGDVSTTTSTTTRNKCEKDCTYLADSKQWWKSAGGGVRYTVVDKNGDLATNYGFDKSYNYQTKTFKNTYYNDKKGDSSKKAVLTGDGMDLKFGKPDWKTHQSLIQQYNSSVAAHGAFIESLVGAAPDQITYQVTSQENGWKGYGSYDFKFFEFFRKKDDTTKFVAKFIALLYALKESYGETLSDDIAKEIAGKACNEDVDLYIIAEPMLGFAVGSYQKDAKAKEDYCSQYKNSIAYDECMKSKKDSYKYSVKLRTVGTLADLGRMMYNDLNDGRLDDDIGSSTFKNAKEVYYGPGNGYANKGQVAWINGKPATVYNTLAIPWFGMTHTFDKTLKDGFYYTYDMSQHSYNSYGAFTSSVKTSQGMWGLTISADSEDCNPQVCDYVDDTLTASNPAGTWKELPAGSKFKNLAEFAFAPREEGGLNCCASLKDKLVNGELKNKPEWKQAYKDYCELNTICTIIDENTITGPNNKIYTKDNYPKSGFEDFGDFVTDTKNRGGLNCCDKIKGKGGKWDEYYDKYCDNNDKDCCTENPIPPATTYNGDLHNCCLDDDVSVIQQTNVTDLFCYNNDKQVSDYFPKCNADTYLEKEVNEYCNLYCSERLMIKQPRPITATTGRYFSFPEIETDVGVKTTAPYLRAYKRCSVTTAWDKWHDAYLAKVNDAIAAYNEYQEVHAMYDIYKKAIETKATVKITGTGTCENSCDSKDAESNEGTYYVYTFGTKTYHKLKLNDSLKNSYSALSLELAGSDVAKHDPTTVEYGHDAAKEAAKPTCSGSSTCVTYKDGVPHSHQSGFKLSSDSYSYSNGGTRYSEENVENTIKTWEQKSQTANSKFVTARNAMKDLEAKLNQCEGYFSGSSTSLPDGSDITVENQKIYELDPKLDFSYTQVVLNENGKKVSDKVKIDFVPKNEDKKQACDFSGPIIMSEAGDTLKSIGYAPKGKGEYVTSDGELKNAAYSSKYSTTSSSKYYELMKLFNVATLTKTADTSGENIQTDAEAYKAQKKFNEFAKYKADCIWIDKGETTTLYPSGLVANTLSTKGLDEKTTYKNYTKHDREYSISTRVLTGTYQTNWNMTGLGEKGKFDKYIQEKGTACSMDSAISSFNPSSKEDDWRFTCAIKITNYTATTGKCEPSSVVAPVDKKNMEPCDPADVVQPTLTFKIVDGKDLFPNTTKSEAGFTDAKNNTYGYNWVTKEGSEAYDKIVSDANQDALFSPDHLAESIKLDSGSIRLIKLYNSKTSGGYSDFNLVCQCEEELQSTLPDNKLPEEQRAGCTKCKSVFLENLQNGTIMIDGKSETINVWAGKDNLTLDKIRSERLGW